MIVRPATIADLAALTDIGIAGYRLGFGDIIGRTGLALFDHGYFSSRFAREWAAIAVAEKGNMILGFSEVRDGTLDMLFIVPSAQRRGIGRLLLAEAEARGAVRLECFRDNRGARSFYEKHGWRAMRDYSRRFAGAEHAFMAYEKPLTGSA